MLKSLLSRRVLKTVRETQKRTISTSGGLERLEMVSEPNTRRCASEEAELRRGWTRGGVPARMLASKGGGLGVPHQLEKGTSASKDAGLRREVDCEIPRRLGRRTKHSL